MAPTVAGAGQETTRRAQPDLRTHVAESLAVWRTQPLLPVLSVSIWGASSILSRAQGDTPPLPGALLAVLLLAVTLFEAGGNGTERIWYLRGDDGAAWQSSSAETTTTRDSSPGAYPPAGSLSGPVDVYVAPSLDAPVIAWLSSGERVELAGDGDQGDFYKVILPNREAGFVLKQHVRSDR